jgi:hypothetical protein
MKWVVLLTLAACTRWPVGTAHPYRLSKVDPGGRWLLLCQAREDEDGDGLSVTYGLHGDVGGDRMRPYLIWGEGQGEPSDDVIAVEPTGRWLVLRRDRELFLVDAETRRWHPLHANVRASSALEGVLSASFSEDGSRLVFVRDRKQVIVRSVLDGKERVIDPGPGLLWNAWTQDGSLLVEVIRSDSDGDGFFDGPKRDELYGTCGAGEDPGLTPAVPTVETEESSDVIQALRAPLDGGELVPAVLPPMADPPEEGDFVVATHAGRSLVSAKAGYFLVEKGKRRRVTLPLKGPSPRWLHDGPYFGTQGVIIDLRDGHEVARYDGEPLALSRGRLLYPRHVRQGRDDFQVPSGPLRWMPIKLP